MIITHKIAWDKCLSHQLWPAIEKGWKDTPMKPIHFFWGLAGNNIKEIRQCIEKGEEWWYVDVGYLTEQITRYPTPIINDYDKTYFRICKGNIHTIKMHVATPERYNTLERQGIDVEFKGWRDSGDYVLLCPSSPTVTMHINGVTQEEWIKQVGEEVRKHTDLPIKMRNKPRPGNEWWGTDIKDDIKNASCVVTNMSLSAVDGLLNMTPAFTHQRHVASFVTSRKINKVEKPFKPGRKTVQEWLNMIANHQFTIQEIEDGLAFDILKVQYQNAG
jgi:hypothetical protein